MFPSDLKINSRGESNTHDAQIQHETCFDTVENVWKTTKGEHFFNGDRNPLLIKRRCGHFDFFSIFDVHTVMRSPSSYTSYGRILHSLQQRKLWPLRLPVVVFYRV